MAMSARGDDFDDDNEEDVTHAALAAVASARLSPTGSGSGRKARQPLPLEFRDLSQDGRRRMGLDGGRVCYSPLTQLMRNKHWLMHVFIYRIPSSLVRHIAIIATETRI